MKTQAKTKSRKPKLPVIDAQLDTDLAPLISYAASTKGTYTRIADRLSELTGTTQHRQLVEKWLAPDARKRTHPRYGVVELLKRIWGEIQAENAAEEKRAAL